MGVYMSTIMHLKVFGLCPPVVRYSNFVGVTSMGTHHVWLTLPLTTKTYSAVTVSGIGLS